MLASRRFLFCAGIAAAVWLLGHAERLSAAEPNGWNVGPRFRQQLELPTDIHWRQNPLRPALENLARQQQVAIFLDRRVDPDQLVDFSVQNVSLERALRQLADQLKIGVARLNDVVYLGPEETAVKLPTLVAIRTEEARKLPTATQRRVLQKSALDWPMLSEPRQVIERIAADAQLTVTNANRIPHDVWPAVELPPLSAVERLSVVLAGFGVTFEWTSSGQELRLVSIPDTVSIQRTYTLASPPADLLPRLREMFPGSKFVAATGRLQVEGPWETHEQVERLLRGEPIRRPIVGKTETRYTLTVRNEPVRGVLQAIAAKLGAELVVHEDAVEPAGQTVSFSVENATLDQLLDAIANPAGLTARMKGDKLVVTRVE